MPRSSLLSWRGPLAFSMIALLALAGCSGDDGERGSPGPQGEQGEQGPPGDPIGAATAAPTGDLSGEITAVSINPTTGIATVKFTVKNADGVPVTGARNFEFTAAKMITATNTKPAYWQSYINTSRLQSGGVTVLRATGERAPATEVAPGQYEYSLCTSLTAAAGFKYYGSGTEPAGSCSTTVVSRSGVLSSAAAGPVLAGLDLAFATNAVTRIGIAARDSGARYNAVIDFRPAQLPAFEAVKAAQIVTSASCGACHSGDSADRSRPWFASFHGNTRYDVALCVTCHNPSTYDSRSSTDAKWTAIDLGTMLHKLHGSAPGYSVAGRDYSHVTYPQNAPFGGVSAIGAGFNDGAAAPGVMNCRTCHDNQSPKVKPQQPADRPEADRKAWSMNISQQACGSCHDGSVATAVNFLDHFGQQTDNSICALCHADAEGKPRPVPISHATPYSTPNNPELVAGAKKVEYEISSVTVDAATGRPTVKFRVVVDGSPLDLKALPANGISIGSVNLKLAWSAPMPAPQNPAHGPAIAKPLDWNNFGSTQGRTYWNNDVSLDLGAYDQPPGVNLSTAGLIASLSGPDAQGYFTTVPGINPASPLAFPTNKGELTLRAVAMESYLSINSMNISGKAALKGVDGTASTLRRKIVDIDNCNTCHERVGFHSNAGRMDNPDYCATCHNPEITSSNIFAGTAMYTGEERYYSQKPNAFKNMIHSIHAADIRKAQNPLDPFNFIRGNPNATGGNGPMVFEDVAYPGRISNCEACHVANSYKVPASGQYAWSAIDVQPSLVAAADRASFNPALTVRQGPSAGACGSCHNSTAAAAHIAANTVIPIGESCDVCHGPGSAIESHKP